MPITRSWQRGLDDAKQQSQKGSRQQPSVYATVTARILEQLEKGTVPWSKPWVGGGPACNAVTLRQYHGCNVFVLACESLTRGYTSRGWLTFNQAREAGVMVRKGERGCPIFFMSQVFKRRTVVEPIGVEASATGDERETVWLARMFYVFSLDQLRDRDENSGKLAFLRSRCDGQRASWEPLEQCEQVIARTDATICEGNHAAYSPSLDLIMMPPRETFQTGAAGYYGTLFHECSHWSGSASRLNRNLSSGKFGSPEYALEELVAELGAAFLSHRCGIDHVSQSAAYLASWLTALRNHPGAFVKAASEAQRAADFIWPEEGPAAAVEAERELLNLTAA